MFWRRKREADLDRELQSHLDLETEEQDGDLRAARRAFGNFAQVQEETRATWAWSRVAQLSRDLRLATRSLWRRPVFTAVAVLSLAIGIGANTAIFSFANAILIRTLPVEGASRLVILRQQNAAMRREICCLRVDVVRRLRQADVGFDDVLGVSDEDVQVRDRGQTERLQAEFVTSNYFSMLGVRPAAGRLFEATDDDAGAGVAVISHNFWIERFGGKADTIGRSIEIDGFPFRIIGVTEQGFSGLSLTEPRDLQIPATMMGPMSHGNGLEAVGRLRAGVSQEQALARLNLVGRSIQRELGQRVSDQDDFRFEDGSQGLLSSKEEFGRPVLILWLLVTCANLTALLLVRSVERSSEAGMRVALGASRFALFRQFLIESFILALTGGTAALGIALLLVKTLSGYLSQSPQISAQVQPDATVFVFSALLTLVTALLFGAWPAWRASKADPLPVVHGALRVTRGRPLLSRGIVSAQVALSLVLLFCAGLFTRTLANLRSIDLGFRPENLIFVQPRLQGTPHEGPGEFAFFQEVLRRAENLPTVRAASLGVISPLSGSTLGMTMNIPGYGSPRDLRPTSLMYYVSPGYFSTMGIPFRTGEDFSPDISKDADSVIVNEEFARRYFDGNPMGKTFSVGAKQFRVIGVVGITKYSSLREEPQPIYYQPIGGQVPPGILLVRTRGNPEQGMEQMRDLIHTVDSSVPINSLFTMEAQIDEILGRERLLAFLSTMFGGIAVGLSAIGLYGVLAFSVVRRTREIGIRIAVGATRSRIVVAFLKEGTLLVSVGVLLGVPLAMVSGRAADSLLYGLSPQDAGTLAGAIVILLFFASAAATLPVWRAARLNAVRALRHE
jgi:predicted permease